MDEGIDHLAAGLGTIGELTEDQVHHVHAWNIKMGQVTGWARESIV